MTELLSVAIREVEKETGLKSKLLDNSIFTISISSIVDHIKRGKYVLVHTHLDTVYLLETDNKEIKCKRVYQFIVNSFFNNHYFILKYAI